MKFPVVPVEVPVTQRLRPEVVALNVEEVQVRWPQWRCVVDGSNLMLHCKYREIFLLLGVEDVVHGSEYRIVVMPAVVEVDGSFKCIPADLSILRTLHHFDRIGDVVVTRIGKDQVVLTRALCKITSRRVENS